MFFFSVDCGTERKLFYKKCAFMKKVTISEKIYIFFPSPKEDLQVFTYLSKVTERLIYFTTVILVGLSQQTKECLFLYPVHFKGFFKASNIPFPCMIVKLF